MQAETSKALAGWDPTSHRTPDAKGYDMLPCYRWACVQALQIALYCLERE